MKTYKKLTFLLAAFLIFATSITAGEVEDIINKHIQAHGGLENWENIKTLKITGAFTGFSILSEFSMVKKQPNLYRNEYGLGKFDVIEVYDGNKGWTIDPWFDVSFPRLLNSAENNVLQQKAEFCTPFFTYKEKGHKVEYLGKADVDGMDALKLKLTRNDGNIETWYLDASTYLELKQESVWTDFGYPQMQETFFDDFRKVQQITIPFYIDRSFGIRNRIYEVKNVEINAEVKDQLFIMPTNKPMEKLKFLEGSWSVIVKANSRRGWRKVDSIVTTITFYKNTSLLQASLIYENYFKFENLYSWSFNSASNNYRMIIFDGFSSENTLLEGNFLNDTLSFSNDGIKVDGVDSNTKNYQKYILSNIFENNFLMEVATSSNKGLSWRIKEKFLFTKIELNVNK